MAFSPSKQSNTSEMTVIVNSEDATFELARNLAPIFKLGDVVTLSGDLGAGKTSFVRALIRSITKQPLLEVPSPTFTLMQSYEGPEFPIVHADLYRIVDSEELTELGFDDAISSALSLIEWPERAPNFFSMDQLSINLEIIPSTNGESRKLTLTGGGSFASRLAKLSSITEFLNSSDWKHARRTLVAGDASGRHFERLSQDGRTAILMSSPTISHGSLAKAKKHYRTAAKLSDSVGSFVAIADGLRSFGFSAPEILSADIDAGLVLVEDLGAESIAGIEGPIAARYGEAATLLAQLHMLELPRELPVRGYGHYQLPDYDIEALLVEAELFLDWYMPAIQQKEVTKSAREQFLTLWRNLLEPCVLEQQTWTLRDYHSPNLFWLEEREGTKRIGLIDIQDAVWGHPAYDLCSLLQDARVPVSEQIELELFECYIQYRRSCDSEFDIASFVGSYAIYAAQRATKVLGIFVRLNERDGKAEYLRFLPQIQSYLCRNLRHVALRDYREWLSQYCNELLIEQSLV